jgi:hypothetical protein
MATRSVSAAKAVALVPANAIVTDVASPEYNRDAMVARLTAAKSAKDRLLLLSALPMGEVAALGGIVAKIGTSINEVLHIKLCDKHGNDWAAVAKALPSELCEADKTRRKEINQSLESIRETVKANAAGDAQKASETIRRVKEWGLGIRKSKSAPNANKKAPLDTWALSWSVFPSAYRRIMRDDMEDLTPAKSEALLGVADAIAAYFSACSISAKSVLECSGETAWNK